MQFLKMLDYIDPYVFIVLFGTGLKMVAPIIKGFHLEQKMNSLYTVAKHAVAYAAQQSGLDNDQRRDLAEKQVADWANAHGLKFSSETMARTIEAAYQFLKNNESIDITPYVDDEKKENGGNK